MDTQTSRPPTLLITGGAGTIGQKLATAWRRDWPIVLVDNRPGPMVVDVDLRYWNDRWPVHFRGVDVVIHLAADPVAYHDWATLVEANIDVTLNVFAAAAQAQVRRVVFASSNHVMGGYREANGPITTDLPPKPGVVSFVEDGAVRDSRDYGASKLVGERIGAHFAATHAMEVVAIRLGWVRRGDNDPHAILAAGDDWLARMWLSDRDTLELFKCAAFAPLPTKFVLVNGMSQNEAMRWDLTATRATLGYEPLDGLPAPAPGRDG